MSIRSLLALSALCAASPAQTPDAIWSGDNADDRWGSVVATLGDVDDDGVLDVGIASPDADAVVGTFGVFPDAGRVEVRSGADGSLLHVWIGDLAGLSRFGYAIADAGDTNGDGHDDVIVGAPRADGAVAASGAAFVYSGATGEQLLRLDGLQVNGRFGHAVAGGRDVNDDGVVDLVVGAPHHDDDDTNGGFGEEGAVWVYSGADGAFVHVEFGTPIVWDVGFPINEKKTWLRRHFGWALAVGGDHDIDGQTDIVATAPLTNYEFDGEGPPSLAPEVGLWLMFDVDDESLAFRSGNSNDRLGWSLASVGEIGGDHGVEFAVGAPGEAPFGTVQVIDAQFGGVLQYWTGTLEAPIGDVVAAVGDWDGDLARDVAIGSPSADVGSPFTIQDAGLVQVRSTGDGSVLAEFSGASGNRIGASVAGAALAVGDSPSLLIGAPEVDAPATNAGAAWFYAGDACLAASASTYGSGWPGTLGVPTLEVTSPPAIGTTFTLAFDNSRGVTTPAWLAYGLAASSTPLKGGTLLVTPLAFVPLTLPPGTLPLPVTLADDDTLCGVRLYLQGLTTDPGASNGVSLTNGVDLVLGG